MKYESKQALIDDIRTEHDALCVLLGIESLSPEQLLVPGHFEWTGKRPLTTYLGPNTASHYRFAMKVIKRWRKRATASGASAARPNAPL